jgi:hypothetical protein
MTRSPRAHFAELAAIFDRHAAALEAEVRALQRSDETAQWPDRWKRNYNWWFAQRFVAVRIWRNWSADAAAWGLLPERRMGPGNGQADLPEDDEAQGGDR